MKLRLLIVGLTVLLAGCDIPGMGADPRAAAKEADGKAIGGACRYSLRGIEDCYALNPKASKTAIFNGWKDMDQYMRENKMEGQASTIEPEEKTPAANAKDKPAEDKPKVADKGKAAEPKSTGAKH